VLGRNGSSPLSVYIQYTNAAASAGPERPQIVGCRRDVAERPTVFDYLDYRGFLRDHYLFYKGRGRGFSYRSFSRRAGLRSPNYLKLVIDGERSLSSEMAGRFASACGLEGESATYFLDLVAFNQAATSVDRNAAYERLGTFKRYRQAHRLEMAQAAYHSTWYVPAIRELAAREDFEADPAWVAARMRPPISAADAKRALDTLFELGLLVKERGRVRQGEPLVTTGSQTIWLHIGNYHRVMMERAAASIDELTAAQRDISSLTLCLGDDGLRRLKERIARFRRELLELSELEKDPREVYQVNFQLFPLTNCAGVEEKQ
jgi:uncharacterized protein (TIGR02147 family)